MSWSYLWFHNGLCLTKCLSFISWHGVACSFIAREYSGLVENFASLYTHHNRSIPSWSCWVAFSWWCEGLTGFHRVLFLVVMSGFLNAKVLKNHRFRSEKDIKAVLVYWLQQQARDFFVVGVYQFALVRNLQIIIVIVCITVDWRRWIFKDVVNKVHYGLVLSCYILNVY